MMRRIFLKLENEKIGKELKRFENMTYSIISICCNNILIGKTYWKVVVPP